MAFFAGYCRWRHWRCSAPTGQVISRGSCADVCFEASRPLSCTILYQTVRSLAGRRPFSVWVQGCVHHTARQESGPGYDWRQFVSTDLELVSCIEASWAHRCSPTDGLFIVGGPPFFVAAWFPTGSFDRNRRPPSFVRAPTSRRPWWLGCTKFSST